MNRICKEICTWAHVTESGSQKAWHNLGHHPAFSLSKNRHLSGPGLSKTLLRAIVQLGNTS